jgi:hypothetical protein
MNVGVATGIPASIAGIPVAQASGSDIDRTHADTAAQRSAISAELHAEKAAGIGETDGEDHAIDERDADGRTPWEFGPAKPAANPQAEEETAQRKSRDVTGESGGQLDLTG